MSMDPAYQAWRGQKLLDTAERKDLPGAASWAAREIDSFAAKILNPARPVAQLNWAALGLGSADEAARSEEHTSELQSR